MPRRHLRLLALTMCVIVSAMLTGCLKRKTLDTTEEITLYYGSKGNEELVAETRDITFGPEDDKYQVVLKELFKGPQTPDLTANIDPQTEIHSITRQDNALIIDVSEDFSRFKGSMAEVIGLASVVNTLTQFEGIEKVKILIDGEELLAPSGEPQGFMEPFDLKP